MEFVGIYTHRRLLWSTDIPGGFVGWLYEHGTENFVQVWVHSVLVPGSLLHLQMRVRYQM